MGYVPMHVHSEKKHPHLDSSIRKTPPTFPACGKRVYLMDGSRGKLTFNTGLMPCKHWFPVLSPIQHSD
jgi:hypothetical protein